MDNNEDVGKTFKEALKIRKNITQNTILESQIPVVIKTDTVMDEVNSDNVVEVVNEIVKIIEVDTTIQNNIQSEPSNIITIEEPIITDTDTIDKFDENDRFSLNNINSDDVEIGIESIDSAMNNSPKIEKSTNIKIGSTGDRKSFKSFSNMNPGPNIKVTDTEEYQIAVIEQYISGTKGGPFIGPKSVTRAILPYSGIYYDISSYTNSDMLGIHRTSSEISFIEKVENELMSAYEHTVGNTFKRKLDFQEWLQSVKYSDLWCIYWAIYNVNHPGVNIYNSTCDHCRAIIEDKRDNYSISYVSDNSIEDITQEDIDKIRNGTDRELINPYKVSSVLIEKENYLPDKKFKVFQGMPNLEEVLTFLKYLKTDLNEDDDTIRRVLYPISWLTYEKDTLTKSARHKILSYKYTMFTRKIYVPVYEEMLNSDKENGKPKVKATYVDVKPILIPILVNGLSKDDFRVLITGKELRKMMVKDGIHFRVKDSICPKCNKGQIPTALDMREILFLSAAKGLDLLMDM